MPEVDIIIPVHNRRTLVQQAIESALAESAEVPLQVIVVDDASTDDTWGYLQTYRDPRVWCIRMKSNGGAAAARNFGLDRGTSPYVKFLDSDDILAPGHLVHEVAALDGTRYDIAVSGWRAESRGQSRTFAAPRFDSIVDDILAGLAVPTSAALYRRRTDWRWDPDSRNLDDWDYFCQSALGATAIATVEGEAYTIREHPGLRLTDTTMLKNARGHHRILHKIEDRLAAEDRLTEPRRRRLAQYFYKELRVLSLYDRPAFEAAVLHIRSLDAHFQPRDEEQQRLMRVAARILGFRNAILLHGVIKRALKPARR